MRHFRFPKIFLVCLCKLKANSQFLNERMTSILFKWYDFGCSFSCFGGRTSVNFWPFFLLGIIICLVIQSQMIELNWIGVRFGFWAFLCFTFSFSKENLNSIKEKIARRFHSFCLPRTFYLVLQLAVLPPFYLISYHIVYYDHWACKVMAVVDSRFVICQTFLGHWCLQILNRFFKFSQFYIHFWQIFLFNSKQTFQELGSLVLPINYISKTLTKRLSKVQAISCVW